MLSIPVLVFTKQMRDCGHLQSTQRRLLNKAAQVYLYGNLSSMLGLLDELGVGNVAWVCLVHFANSLTFKSPCMPYDFMQGIAVHALWMEQRCLCRVLNLSARKFQMPCSPRKLCSSQEAGGSQSTQYVPVRDVAQHAADFSSCFKHGSCRQ